MPSISLDRKEKFSLLYLDVILMFKRVLFFTIFANHNLFCLCKSDFVSDSKWKQWVIKNKKFLSQLIRNIYRFVIFYIVYFPY